MKNRDLFRKLQLLGALALGTAPAVVLVFAHFCPDRLQLAPVWSLGFLVLSVLGLLSPGKWRLAWALPTLAVLGALSWKILWLPGLAAWLFYGGLFLWSLQLGRWEREDEIPPLVTVALLGLQLAGQLLLFADSLKPEPVLEGCAFLLKGSFLGFLLLTVLGLNRTSMNNASGEKRSVTRTVRRRNLWMTLGLFGLGVGASFIPYIYEWIRKAVLWTVAAILWLLSRLLPDQEDAGGSGGDSGDMGGLLPQEETEPSLLLEILETVLMVLVCILVLALVCYVIWRLVRFLKRLLKKLWTALGKYAQTVSEDYVDEITDTRENGEGSRSRSRFGRARPKAPKGGTPEERVRYRYKLLLWKHPEWNKGTTAREKLPEKAAEIYERARYSEHPVTDAEAEAFHNYKL